MRVSEKKAAQRTALGIEAVWRIPQPKEHFLNDFLGLGVVAEQSFRQAEHRPGMAAVRLGQRTLAVSGDGHHERGI